MANGNVFISYRRSDALHAAGHIRYRLLTALPKLDVFMDVDSMPAGVDALNFLRDKVATADVLLALIGPDWSSVRDSSGQRRIDADDDYVRVEIAAALSHNIPIVPVALDGAAYPQPQELPENIRALATRAGVDIRGASFDADVAKLLARLEPLIKRNAIAIGIGLPAGREQKWLVPGDGASEWLRDFDAGPDLVVVPAGRFTMGSPLDEPGRDPEGEGCETQSTVTIPKPLAIGRFAVTHKQFGAFVTAARYNLPAGAKHWSESKGAYRPSKARSWQDPGFEQAGHHPVVAVNWHDANAYTRWLSECTGRRYRLPTSAEWEYAARAGSKTPFHWGTSISPAQANYDARTRYRGGGDRGGASTGTVAASRYAPNSWGLYQVHGNVWELCEDAWPDHPDIRVCRGGSFEDGPDYLRAAMCGDVEEGVRYVSVGFRVVRDIGD